MTRAEAERECERLRAEHPDRGTHQWQPRQEPSGAWSVVKIALPPPRGDDTNEVKADEKPVTPDDPRLGIANDVFGPYGY